MDLVKFKVLLERLDEDMLKYIFSQLKIETTENEKYQLINKLNQEMINNNVLNDLLLCMDQTSFDVINTVIDRRYLSVDKNDPLIDYYEALSGYGILLKIVNNDFAFYTISIEVYEMIEKNKRKIKEEININQIILKFAKAAVNYYGLLDKEETLELFQFYHRYSVVDIFPRLAYLSHVQSIFTFNGEYLYDNNVFDIEAFIKTKEHFKGLTLYKYNMEQFYVDERFLSIDIDFDFYNELVAYFSEEIKCHPSIIVAIYYFLMCEHDMDKLKATIEEETVVDVNKLNKRFDDYVKKLYQSVRCWVLKGHMVSEVNEMIESNPKLYIESDFVLLKKPEKKKKRGFFW